MSVSREAPNILSDAFSTYLTRLSAVRRQGRLSRGLWADPSFGNLRFPSNKSGSFLRASKGDGWKPLNAVSDSGSEKTLRVPDSALFNEKFVSPSPTFVLPSTTTSSMPIGLALETSTHAPVVHQPLRPVRKGVPSSTTKAKRMSSVVTSMYGGAEISSPTFTETMIAYQTPRPAPSPGKPKPALKPSTTVTALNGSLKKSNSGSQGRSAANPRRHSVSKEKEDPSFAYVIPSVKSQERRDRDTKASPSALAWPPPHR